MKFPWFPVSLWHTCILGSKSCLAVMTGLGPGICLLEIFSKCSLWMVTQFFKTSPKKHSYTNLVVLHLLIFGKIRLLMMNSHSTKCRISYWITYGWLVYGRSWTIHMYSSVGWPKCHKYKIADRAQFQLAKRCWIYHESATWKLHEMYDWHVLSCTCLTDNGDIKCQLASHPVYPVNNACMSCSIISTNFVKMYHQSKQ